MIRVQHFVVGLFSQSVSSRDWPGRHLLIVFCRQLFAQCDQCSGTGSPFPANSRSNIWLWINSTHHGSGCGIELSCLQFPRIFCLAPLLSSFGCACNTSTRIGAFPYGLQPKVESASSAILETDSGLGSYWLTLDISKSHNGFSLRWTVVAIYDRIEGCD